MDAKKRPNRAVPENINEEYYQINSEILASFPKYRPPVDLFFFREDIAVLAPFSRKGARLSNEQVEEVNQLCEDGNLFVSRSDHHIYFEHMIKQLDLILQDKNLKEAEIVSICINALQMRYEAFYNQPVKMAFDPLHRDTMVFTEYITGDKVRINAFMRRLFREHTPANHALNTMFTGLWMWMNRGGENLRKDIDNLAIGLLTHDIGMSKMPPFILAKKGPLKGDEREKILLHPLQSAKIMQKMELPGNDIIFAGFEHHERLDGSGYPQHVKGDQIHPAGKLTALADSFSAMITNRVYAPAMEPMKAATTLSEDNRYEVAMIRPLVGAFAMGKL